MKPVPFLQKDMLTMSVITGLSVGVAIVGGQGVLLGLICAPFAWCGWFLILDLFKKRGS